MMSIAKDSDVRGGTMFFCDRCGEPHFENDVLHWDCKDFSLCFVCLAQLTIQHLAPVSKAQESVIVRRRYIAEDTRKAIYQRDGYRCVKCESGERLQIDHITPFSLGGSTDPENLQTLCANCNSTKGNRIEAEK